MHNHAPLDYVCPFCLLVQGKEHVESQLKLTDIVFQMVDITAFMATRKYPNNQGHVLIVPNEHFENIYDLPLDPVCIVESSFPFYPGLFTTV